MREILFRAKRKNWRELPKEEWWVEGYLVKYQPCASKDEYVYGIVPTYASALYIIEIDPETLCQYTGLTDKNGKRIWENDIVKYMWFGNEEVDIVEYRSTSIGLKENYNAVLTDITEVIGNIFDDKHLLAETDYCREQEKETEVSYGE